MGLRVHRRDGATAALGTGGEDVLVLTEEPSARPPGRHAGLYHVALLFPTREELAHAAVRLAVTRTPIEGASDHGTHEAIYLPDPDGNGLELAADRPRDLWPDLSGPGAYAGGPDPLDVRALLAVAGDPGTAPRPHAGPGLAVGHVHLHVPDLEAELSFHRDVLGFDVVTELPTAVFVSAGGYHHHVAFNLWRGRGIPARPRRAPSGLRHWTVVVDGAGSSGRVRARAERAGVTPESATAACCCVTRRASRSRCARPELTRSPRHRIDGPGPGVGRCGATAGSDLQSGG